MERILKIRCRSKSLMYEWSWGSLNDFCSPLHWSLMIYYYYYCSSCFCCCCSYLGPSQSKPCSAYWGLIGEQKGTKIFLFYWRIKEVIHEKIIFFSENDETVMVLYVWWPGRASLSRWPLRWAVSDDTVSRRSSEIRVSRWVFPSGPVVKISSSSAGGCGFNPCLGS